MGLNGIAQGLRGIARRCRGIGVHVHLQGEAVDIRALVEEVLRRAADALPGRVGPSDVLRRFTERVQAHRVIAQRDLNRRIGGADLK
ncbi:hypothetical protein D9M68_997790 [compost metagenome]